MGIIFRTITMEYGMKSIVEIAACHVTHRTVSARSGTNSEILMGPTVYQWSMMTSW